jgi:hypothetical protein
LPTPFLPNDLLPKRGFHIEPPRFTPTEFYEVAAPSGLTVRNVTPLPPDVTSSILYLDTYREKEEPFASLESTPSARILTILYANLKKGHISISPCKRFKSSLGCRILPTGFRRQRLESPVEPQVHDMVVWPFKAGRTPVFQQSSVNYVIGRYSKLFTFQLNECHLHVICYPTRFVSPSSFKHTSSFLPHYLQRNFPFFSLNFFNEFNTHLP